MGLIDRKCYNAMTYTCYNVDTVEDIWVVYMHIFILIHAIIWKETYCSRQHIIVTNVHFAMQNAKIHIYWWQTEHPFYKQPRQELTKMIHGLNNLFSLTFPWLGQKL